MMNTEEHMLDELRDSFAAAALTGLLANRTVTPQDTTLITRRAWEIAEEMLRVRQNRYAAPAAQSQATQSQAA